MDKHGIAVFDVCGTITQTNNTSDFIAFVLKRDKASKYVLLFLIRALARLLGMLRLGSRSFHHALRARQIALLKGYPSTRLREMAERYVDWLDAQDLWNHKLLEALEQERQRGRRVLLVSAALDPPIRQIARRLGIESFRCSELEMTDERCTGKLKTDLLGHKESVLEKLSAQADLQESSVYSDNEEDVPFMEHFGTRTIVVNGIESAPTGETMNASLRHLADVHGERICKDVHAVNERNVRWAYVPFLYYSLSRFHSVGLLTVLLREIIPFTVAGFLATRRDTLALVLMPLSFLMFYAIYEIGGLVNDLAVKREPSALSLQRIAPQVDIHVVPFVTIRLALVALVWTLASREGYPMSLYLAALAFCLAVYFLHTLILGRARMLTFLLLKICRASIPVLILAPRLGPGTLVGLCVTFTALDAPWRLYAYSHRRGLMQGTLARWVRCAPGMILTALGVVIYLLSGSWLVLVIASYYAILDGATVAWMKG
ncbi:MAG: HAD-IB family phosphatase [Sedimentisphaerales bacterium]|nr:HAD-IB family phosphatase [Sedimentisphaerales bacterium]